MKGPGGGSVHDPGSQMPDAMWSRQTQPTTLTCMGCKVRRRHNMKRRLQVDTGPRPGFYLICFRCDGGPGQGD